MQCSVGEPRLDKHLLAAAGLEIVLDELVKDPPLLGRRDYEKKFFTERKITDFMLFSNLEPQTVVFTRNFRLITMNEVTRFLRTTKELCSRDIMAQILSNLFL